MTTAQQPRRIAVLPGRSQVVITLGYSHLVDQQVMAAAQRIDGHLAEAFTPSNPVEPILYADRPVMKAAFRTSR